MSSFSDGTSPRGPIDVGSYDPFYDDSPWSIFPNTNHIEAFGSSCGDSLWSSSPVVIGADILVRYPLLSWIQQEVYDEILRHLRQRICEFEVITDCEANDINIAFAAIAHDHPELFWLTGASSVRTTTGGSFTTRTLSVSTEYPMTSVPSMQRRIDAVVSKFTSTLPRVASSYDKVRSAYEFVINNTAYDKSAPHNQSMAAAFIDHRAVCAGYSKAFCYLLRSAGIPCGCVEGMAKSGGISGRHLWNIVQINGVYTYVDATWGELEISQGSGRKKSEGISYDYLCVTTEEILRSRTIDSGQALPQCTSRTFDWFLRQGLLLEGFSFSRFDSLLVTALNKSARKVTVKFTTQDAYDQCIHWMSTSGIFSGAFGDRLRRASPRRRSSISWTYNDNLRVVSVSW